LLGVEGHGFQQLAAGLQRERIMAGVLALSGAAQALEDTKAYLRERHAFDGPLSQKQALRHRVADMATEIEAARCLLYRAASSTPRARTASPKCPWPSSSPPRWPTASPTRPCSSTAATATCGSSPWNASSATCASGPSPPAPPRS